MTKYLSVTDTAKLVRAALKAGFPGVKFSVRSDKYSGGASIDISWTDGPYEKDVEKVANRYQGTDFDGMQDMKIYRSGTLIGLPGGEVEEVKFGADFVFTHRELSPEYLAELTPHAEAVLDDYSATYGKPFALDAWYEGVPTPGGIFPQGSGHNLLWFLSKEVAPGAPAPTPRLRSATPERGQVVEVSNSTPDAPAPVLTVVRDPEPTPAVEAPGPAYFTDKICRVMADEEAPDPTVGLFLMAARGYLIARDESPFAWEALKGYRTALTMMLATDAMLPDGRERIDTTIMEALAYWTQRGYR
jgi:hypothetical protein